MSLGMRLPDSDVLVSLCQQDPEAFEAYRRHMLREAVDEAPPAHRPALEQLVVRIEEARQEAETPMEAVLAASRLMQESVNRLHAAWEDAQGAVAGLQTSLIIERMRSGGLQH